MAIFLTVNQLYRLLQRELPEGLYPDGDPTKSYSAASIHAKSGLLATVYQNLARIYDNYFPHLADEYISDWEIAYFNRVADASMTLSQRRDAVLRQIRARPTLAVWELLTLVASYLPEGIYCQIVEWGFGDGASWILDVSRLNVNAALGWGVPSSISLSPTDPESSLVSDGWRFEQSHLDTQTRLDGSITWQALSAVENKAYTYEVRIFGYTLSASQLEQLIADLKRREPARSGRIIKQNQVLLDYGLVFPVSPVDQYSLVNCVTRDSGSSTGYSGMEHA